MCIFFPEQSKWIGVPSELEKVHEFGNGAIKVGSLVKIKTDVQRPKGGWGSIEPDSIGTVMSK